MKIRNVVLASIFAAASGSCLAAVPASAYTACNRDRDCWHTDTRVHVPGITLNFHDDKWGDANRGNARYHWHDADAGHDSHHGYWSHGEWHSS